MNDVSIAGEAPDAHLYHRIRGLEMQLDASRKAHNDTAQRLAATTERVHELNSKLVRVLDERDHFRRLLDEAKP